MINRTKYLLASTAITACMMQATPSLSDTTVQETVTQTPDATTQKKTVTETAPGSTAVSTTVTTDQKGADGTVTHYKSEQYDTTTDTRTVNLMDYSDAGVLTTNEVGKMLFKIFDADKNNVIDSNEYERHYIVNFSPMEKNTVVTYKFNRGGETKETTTTTYDTFMHDTRLTDFNNDKAISAHEFADMSFNLADVNRDHAIDLKEWQGTYDASVDRANKANADINNK